MPESALRNVNVDQVVNHDAIAPALEQLSREPPSHSVSIPDELVVEAQFAETGMTRRRHQPHLGRAQRVHLQ
jgi:hypothetical protein